VRARGLSWWVRAGGFCARCLVSLSLCLPVSQLSDFCALGKTKKYIEDSTRTRVVVVSKRVHVMPAHSSAPFVKMPGMLAENV